VHDVAVSADLLDVAAPSCHTALFTFATVITAAVRVDPPPVWVGCELRSGLLIGVGLYRLVVTSVRFALCVSTSEAKDGNV
jgi:hypothetical protein